MVGFDESGCYCNKRPDWAWIAQTVYFTLLFRASGRGSKVQEERFGDALHRMTAVTDRHSAYFALNFLDHQVCLAHLLRELQYLDELNPKQEWSRNVAALFREAIHTRNENPNAIIESYPNVSEAPIAITDCKTSYTNDCDSLPRFTFDYRRATRNTSVIPIHREGRIFDTSFDFTFN